MQQKLFDFMGSIMPYLRVQGYCLGGKMRTNNIYAGSMNTAKRQTLKADYGIKTH